jgi:hypothetical protein
MLKDDYLLTLLLMIVFCVYIIIIINLSKPYQVSTVRYLPITASNTIKVKYGHTCIVYTRNVCRRVVG